MLQIATGKLFTRATDRENSLRGVLFTNLNLGQWPEQVLEGPLFGRLVQTSELTTSPKTLVYEFTERIEVPQSGRAFLISHCAEPYLQDMATVVSFALNCTCSPDVDLVRRLTSGQRGVATRESPNNLVRRIFDKEVFLQPSEADEFVRFVNHLLGLHRKVYLCVMRAIRTYVTALHRVADDLELAYTLMVAAGESLAQEFDGHIPDWESVAEVKRCAIDQALDGAPDEVAQRVREAILRLEHTALARRFQAFVTENVAPEYFRAQFEGISHPVGRSDLPEVLTMAYQVRSKYMHQLSQLPDMVTLGDHRFETIIDGRCRMLTLQGLSKLIRHVITTFVQRQPTVEKEAHDYLLEMPGVAQVQLAPSLLIAHAHSDISGAGRDTFEGFLEELATVLMRQPDAAITNISEVLTKFVAQAPNIEKNKRRPYLALLVMFNAIAGEMRIPRTAKVEALIQRDLGALCSEALVALAFFGEVPEWSLEDHYRQLRTYRCQRRNKSGIRFPRVFEAAVALELAERYRSAGQFKRCKEVVGEAADDYPEHTELRKLVEVVAEDTALRWREILLPKQEAHESEPSSEKAFGVAGATTSPRARKVKRRVRTPKPVRVRRR